MSIYANRYAIRNDKIVLHGIKNDGLAINIREYHTGDA